MLIIYDIEWIYLSDLWLYLFEYLDQQEILMLNT